MEQATPEVQASQPQSAPVQPAAVPAVQAKKTPVWVWILGGCFGIIILGMLTFGILIYLGAKKVRKEFRENGSKWEQMQDDAGEFQREMDKIQKEIEKSQPQPTAESVN